MRSREWLPAGPSRRSHYVQVRQKITLSVSYDVPFKRLVLSQANVRLIKSGVSIEESSHFRWFN
jgi:ParB family chromosome partitioning protein